MPTCTLLSTANLHAAAGAPIGLLLRLSTRRAGSPSSPQPPHCGGRPPVSWLSCRMRVQGGDGERAVRAGSMCCLLGVAGTGASTSGGGYQPCCLCCLQAASAATAATRIVTAHSAYWPSRHCVRLPPYSCSLKNVVSKYSPAGGALPAPTVLQPPPTRSAAGLQERTIKR